MRLKVEFMTELNLCLTSVKVKKVAAERPVSQHPPGLMKTTVAFRCNSVTTVHILVAGER